MKNLIAVAVMGLTVAKSGAALFDGHSLNGWHAEGDAKWSVVDGTIVSDQSGDGWLRTDKQYADFTLSLDFRNSPKGNSGVFFRTTAESKSGEPNPAGGYELQIYNEDPTWPTGSIEDVIQRKVIVNPAPNQWHRYVLEVRGDSIKATVDGKKVLDGRDSKYKSGYIGLQHHRNSKIEFRNIVLNSN